ncbi:hypothetical protein JW721_05655 [Candidatus Micrarchaeota archaeon]|nr:hypothetical protein [Candidatus Micrarchaeota archaeon]
MAMKERRRQKEASLNMTPKFDTDYVEEVLESAYGKNISGRIIDAVAESGSTEKLRAFSHICTLLRESRENGEEAFSLRYSFFRNYLKPWRRTADFLVENAETISAACKLGGKNLLPWALYGKHMPSLISNHPKELISILKAAGTGAASAFYLLDTHTVAKAFEADPKKVAKELIEISKICGRGAGLFFDIMNNGELPEVFAKRPEDTLKIAEASACWGIIVDLKDRPSEGFFDALVEAVDKYDAMEKEEGHYYSLCINYSGQPEPFSRITYTDVSQYREKWEDGRKLAREAGVKIEDREVFLNFAYAQDKIGKEKAIALHREFGIEYFARYTQKELDDAYEQIGRMSKKTDKRPVLFRVYNKYDYNKAFYSSDMSRVVEKGYYQIIPIEVETEEEFFRMARKFGKYSKISAVLFGGHGQEGNIRLGPGESEEYYLDLNDKREFELLGKILGENPLIILEACSTGQKLGPKMSWAFGATLFAPKAPSSLMGFEFGDKGEILSVKYSKGVGAKFVLGEEVPEDSGFRENPFANEE